MGLRALPTSTGGKKYTEGHEDHEEMDREMTVIGTGASMTLFTGLRALPDGTEGEEIHRRSRRTDWEMIVTGTTSPSHFFNQGACPDLNLRVLRDLL
jgi:hypothetical protein